MIVKFLRKSETFKGVNYNSRKVDKDKGELMLVSGFEALQGMDHLRPSDYINYLEAVSAKSSRIQFPQLHVAISCKGDSYNKHELTTIAKEWMKGMGYEQHPYIVVFHNDTDNAHVHIVSTRIGRSGKKLRDSYEHRKAYQVLNRIMMEDTREQLSKALTEVLAYRFSTHPQFAMLMEAKGYQLSSKDGDYELFKFGVLQGTIPLATVDTRISMYDRDKKRIIQLRAILEKYRHLYSGAVFPVSLLLPGGRSGPAYVYSSELAEVLHKKVGVQLLYHGVPGKPPYGFSVLDHAEKMILKGKELMDIKELLIPKVVSDPENHANIQTVKVPSRGIESLKVSIPDVMPAERDIVRSEMMRNPIAEQELSFEKEDTLISALEGLSLDIADDVDDEQVLGPSRRRKRKARTNTR
jgi:hypothetical protein